MKTPRQLLDEQMSEDDLLKNVIEMAALFKWRFGYHVFDSGSKIQCPRCDFLVPGRYARRLGEGFPDLILGRVKEDSHRGIAAELKSMTGKVTEAQEAWLRFFNLMHFETYLLRPPDWSSGRIEEILK